MAFIRTSARVVAERYVCPSMPSQSPQFVQHKLRLHRSCPIYKANMLMVSVVLLAMTMTACSSSAAEKASSESTVLTSASDPTSLPLGETSSTATPRATPSQLQPSINAAPKSSASGPGSPAVPSLSQGSSQQGTPAVTAMPPQITVPPTSPRFVPFQCSLSIRETSQQPSPNTSAIRVDISIVGSLPSTVWLEALSDDLRDRKSVSISKTGTGSTQLVVRLGKGATVTAYAAPDFEADARMCAAKR